MLFLGTKKEKVVIKMKKAKRLLALVLGLMMLLGCVSVSAANAPLTVTEKPVKTYFETDFSAQSANVEIVEPVAPSTTKVENGALKITNTNVATELKTKIYAKANKTGIAEPVFVEFDVSHNGLFQYGGNDIEMFFVSSTNGFIDFRWLSDRNVQFYDGASNKHLVNLGYVYSMHIKVKIDPLAKKYAMWINDKEIVGEDEYNYIRNASKFNDFSFLQIKTTGEMSEVAIDNFIVYSDPQTAFPMVEELYNEPFDSEGGSKKLTNANNDFDISGITSGENVAYEVDISGETGNSNLHYVMFRNDDKGIYSRVEWNTSGNNDVMHLRVWDTASKYVIKDVKVSDYASNDGKLKITAVFSADCGSLKVYVNGIFFHEYEFTNKNGTPKVLRIGVATNGSVTVDNIRVYKFINELSIIEEENTVKIATPEAKSGNLYFAKYNGEGNNKTLASLGIAPLKLAPGKIYRVDKTDWAGAKAFFWDKDLTPIVEPWNLAE